MEHTPLERLMTILELQIGLASVGKVDVCNVAFNKELSKEAVTEYKGILSNINQLRIMLHSVSLNPDNENLLKSIRLLEHMFDIQILENKE